LNNKIRNRREKISHYLVKQMKETSIAKILGVSRLTVVRDVSYLKKASRNWLDGLAKDGFIFEYKTGLDRIREHGLELAKLLEKPSNIEQKRRILKSMDDNAKLYLQLLGEAPTIHAFRKATLGRE